MGLDVKSLNPMRDWQRGHVQGALTDPGYDIAAVSLGEEVPCYEEDQDEDRRESDYQAEVGPVPYAWCVCWMLLFRHQSTLSKYRGVVVKGSCRIDAKFVRNQPW